MPLKTMIAAAIWLNLFGLSAGRANDWTEQPQGFKYESQGFCCQILPDGRLTDLRWQNTRLIREIRLRGDALPEKSDKNCVFWQHEAKERETLATRPAETEAVEARLRLVVGGGELARAAAVELFYRLSPDGLRLEANLETLCPMRTQFAFFIFHALLDEKTFSGRGGMLYFPRSAPRWFLTPLAKTAPGGLNLSGWDEWRAVLPQGEAVFRIEGGGSRLLDDPGWGGKFSLHAFEPASWFAAPVLYPAGRTYRLNLALAFAPLPK